MTPKLANSVLEHFLRIIGMGKMLARGRFNMVDPEDQPQDIMALARTGRVFLALRPTEKSLSEFGARKSELLDAPWRGRINSGDQTGPQLRGFGSAQTFEGQDLEPVLVAPSGAAIWSWRQIGKGGVLLCGTDLAADTIRFRQGDPNRKPTKDELNQWGYAGERPNYLFDENINKSRPHDRPADWPLFALADFVRAKLNEPAKPLLPDGASCAVVVTGDTDGATPQHYAEQRRLLRNLPITYFLRTACAASVETLRSLDRDERVDLQLHPDALDAPAQYGALLQEQIAFFVSAIGRRPDSLRNHGYLNDGYWRHAKAWIEQKLTWSANLPGVDGFVLNGSLLPGRLFLNGALSPHWSLVTPYGDGMVFAMKLSAEDAAARFEAHIMEIAQSGAPGVVAINLHPANVDHTAALHDVMHGLDRHGAIVWSLAQCADWFERLDGPNSLL